MYHTDDTELDQEKFTIGRVYRSLKSGEFTIVQILTVWYFRILGSQK
jgi:hypothetical protein